MRRRPCIVRRCPEYATDSSARCEKHEREWEQGRWDRGSTGRRGSRPRWRKLRAKVWAEQGRRCFRCQRGRAEGVTTFHVHHLDGNARNDDRDNLVGLCPSCHSLADKLIRQARAR